MRYGHFDDAACEYVIDRVDVPVSWTNYLGGKDFATVIGHTGGGYSYYKRPQSGRITRFRQNGVPTDRPGKYVYLRDTADGDYWSISWQPVGKPLTSGTWTAAHGTGYTRFVADYRDIHATQTVFVPLDDDVEVWGVELTNTGATSRTLEVTGYVEFSFNNIEIDNQNLQMSLYSQGADYADGIVECDAFYEPWTFNYFASALTELGGAPQSGAANLPESFDCLRDSFIGPWRDERNPIGIERGRLSDSAGTTQNHCGALEHRVELAPGESARLVFLLGHGSRDAGKTHNPHTDGAGRRMRSKYAAPGAVQGEYRRLVDHWREKQARLQVNTPDPGMNTMLNTWTLYQAETCVVWSRFASFVEVGGRTGLGYRDTAQDAMSVIHSNPAKTRQRLLELLRAQTREGFGLHLFDPVDFDPHAPTDPDIPTPTIVPRGSVADLIHGLEDVCSDDHLWLVPTIIEYVRETGDVGFLDERVPFAQQALEAAQGSGLGAADPNCPTVWDHLVAALDFTSEQIGANGVARGLRADWNDCLNLGGGETALGTFLHAWAIGQFLQIAQELGRTKDVPRFTAELQRIAKVADTELWDGDWWRRGITRDGVVIGSRANEEGKIFLEHQAWPTIAGITTAERGRKTLDSVAQLLGSEYGTHLNWPAFTKVDDTVGFLTRVYPGIKENAAIFSHPNAWPIIAETKLGRGDQALAFYDSILPYYQNDNIDVRQAEPYAYVQFLYGRDHPRFGLAQNPWLTGTAGWMYTAATKHILGIRPTLDGLLIDPCIPAAWPGFTVRRKWRGATYEIAVQNPDGVCAGVAKLAVTCEQDPLVVSTDAASKKPLLNRPGVSSEIVPVEVADGTRPAALVGIAPAGSTVRVEVVLGN